MKEYIHEYEQFLVRELELINDSSFSLENKLILLDFYKYNKLNGISVPRLVKQLGSLRLVSNFVNKSFVKVERSDYEQFLLYLMDKKRSKATLSTYMEILKVFHKWLAKSSTYPDCVSWMKCGDKNSKKLPEHLLVQEDIKDILLHAPNLRDKALISVLWESGARIGEVGGMNIKHISFDEFGCKLTLDGKTGMRRIRIVNAAEALLKWLNIHPKNKNPEAPVFINITQDFGHRMGHRNIMKILKTIGKRAKITKPINPHHFRHSRATYCAQFLTEAQMNEYFGWVNGSRMAAKYVHLSGKQVDDAILRMHGLKKEDKLEDILKNILCPRCKTLNENNHTYCTQCWLPLTQQAAIEAEEKKQKEETGVIALLKIINKYRDNPQQLEQTLKTIGGEIQ